MAHPKNVVWEESANLGHPSVDQTELYRELLQSKLSKQTAFVDFSLYCYEPVPNQYPSSYVQVTLQLLDLCYI